MARKWRKMAAIRRIRMIGSLPKSSNALAEKGHFVVYSIEKRRFEVPLAYLSSHIFRELFRMSEEEFGIPRDGPITLPCDTVSLEYVVSIVQGSVCKETENAVLIALAPTQCSASGSIFEGFSHHRQMISHGF